MEKNKKINIFVTGDVNSGKSVISYYIKWLLEEDGVKIDFTPNSDFKDEEIYNRLMNKHIENGAITSILSNATVTLYDDNFDIKREVLSSSEFYELMQSYRNAPLGNQKEVSDAFENVKKYIMKKL